MQSNQQCGSDVTTVYYCFVVDLFDSLPFIL